MDSVKIIAQLSPTANTLTDAYTVPANTSTTLSSICICNTNSFVTYFRISVAKGGVVDNPSQYIYYDLPIAGNDTFIATIGLTLASSDVIRVRSFDTAVAFNFSGIEIT